MTNETTTNAKRFNPTEQVIATMLDDSFTDQVGLENVANALADWNYHIVRQAIACRMTTKQLEILTIENRPMLCVWLKPNGDFFSASALRDKVGSENASYKHLNAVTKMHAVTVEAMGLHKVRLTPFTEAEKSAKADKIKADERLEKAENDEAQRLVDEGLTVPQAEIRLEGMQSEIEELKRAIQALDTTLNKPDMIKQIEDLKAMV